MPDLSTRVGRTELRNPIIAGPADHFIDDEGVRRAIKTGVGAVVLKSVNETQSAKDQLAVRRIPRARRALAAGAVGT
jgi:dihydroorotate dehydrogenase (NAD+) catalytic subunit